MSESNSQPPRLNKLPFWLADAVLIGAAATLVAVGGRPLRAWEMVAVAACAALGGWLAVLGLVMVLVLCWVLVLIYVLF